MPLVLTTYEDPVLAMGLATFAQRAASAGIDGAIVPDISLEASLEFREAFDPLGVELIQIVTPSMPPVRAGAVARTGRGFLYATTRDGTTGARSTLPLGLRDRISALREMTSLPICVGFGVSTRNQVQAVRAAGADGVVVGSAIVNLVADRGDPELVRRLVSDLAVGLTLETTASPVLRGSSR